MVDSPSVVVGIECARLQGVDTRVVDLNLSEALDAPYHGVVDLHIGDRNADPLALFGADVVLTLERPGLSRKLCGVVSRVWEGTETDDDALRTRIEVVPALELLSLGRDTRIFQEMSVPEILEEVLGTALGVYGRSVELDLNASYPTREYCVQYRQSDRAFAERLMEEEGIHYRFDHESEVEVMVLGDQNASFAEAPSFSQPLFYEPQVGEVATAEPIHRLVLTDAHTATSVLIRDFDWSTPGILVEDEAPGEGPQGRTRQRYEHGLGHSITLSQYGGERYEARDTPAQKERRQEEHLSQALVGRGISRVIGFAPGATFELVGHPSLGVDGTYLLTRVEHETQPSAELEGAAQEHYHNRFECVPLETAYRPRRDTRKPSIASVQTAIVTGPSGEEIHTDEHGRVKVRFHWDRLNAADERSSCWVRVEQAWAGESWGFSWLPRIGMEVVVHFVDGDADRPLITGCVYNGDNPPPYALPDEKTKSTIKSSSSPGGDGFNELRFEDKAGSEEIFTHAQKDYNEVVEHNHSTDVAHDQSNVVDNNQVQQIDNNQTETVHGNQEMSVGADRKVNVVGNFDEVVDGTETRTVTGDVSEDFGANETRTIGANITENIGGSETRTVAVDQNETIGANHAQTVGGSLTRTIGANLTLNVLGGITETAAAGYNLTATAGLNVVAAGGVKIMAPAGMKLTAPGGVTWVDSSDTWWGQLKEISSPTSHSFTGVKIEMGGMASGLNGFKAELAQVELVSATNMKVSDMTCMVMAGARTVGGGLRKRIAGLRNYGG